MPGIAVFGCPADGPSAATADPERRMGTLHRLRKRVDSGEIKVLPLKVGLVSGPNVLEDLYHLVGN